MITQINRLTIVAMPTEFAQRIRRTRQDDYGNHLAPQVDDGSAPCRHCLRLALPGEEVILFSYRPFSRQGLYQEVGPVFIHAHGCPRYAQDGGIPPVFQKRVLMLRPYDEKDDIYTAQIQAAPGEAVAVMNSLFARPEVAYIHARSVTRGCYMFRIERA